MSAQLNTAQYPAGYVPIVTFDTSTHNRLFDDAASEEQLALIRALRHVRVAGLSVEEMFATPDPSEREQLFKYAKRITEHDESDTLVPHNELIRRLVLAHHENPWRFDWTTVDVRTHEYHDGLSDQELIADNALANEQRQQSVELQKQFRQMFTTSRPSLDEVFARNGTPRPLTFREALRGVAGSSHRLDTTIAKRFYDRITETNQSRSTVGEFLSVCPPFRAGINGIMLAWYDLAVRDQHQGERFRSGASTSSCLCICRTVMSSSRTRRRASTLVACER